MDERERRYEKRDVVTIDAPEVHKVGLLKLKNLFLPQRGIRFVTTETEKSLPAPAGHN